MPPVRPIHMRRTSDGRPRKKHKSMWDRTQSAPETCAEGAKSPEILLYCSPYSRATHTQHGEEGRSSLHICSGLHLLECLCFLSPLLRFAPEHSIAAMKKRASRPSAAAGISSWAKEVDIGHARVLSYNPPHQQQLSPPTCVVQSMCV